MIFKSLGFFLSLVQVKIYLPCLQSLWKSMMDYTGKNLRGRKPPFLIVTPESHSLFEDYACAEFCMDILQVPLK